MTMRRFTVLAARARRRRSPPRSSPFASASPDGLERVAGDKRVPRPGPRAPCRSRARARLRASRASATRALATGLAGFAGTLARVRRSAAP